MMCRNFFSVMLLLLAAACASVDDQGRGLVAGTVGCYVSVRPKPMDGMEFDQVSFEAAVWSQNQKSLGLKWDELGTRLEFSAPANELLYILGVNGHPIERENAPLELEPGRKYCLDVFESDGGGNPQMRLSAYGFGELYTGKVQWDRFGGTSGAGMYIEPVVQLVRERYRHKNVCYRVYRITCDTNENELILNVAARIQTPSQ